ncbi:putative sensor domain DACNV-containing protein [Chitinophaga agri]|uniref:putative sensor domain DACNV-containing protein n=1 Tax=Chitinophaga agri TaxID=2703787 RepID=UPI00192EF4EB|nr:hypothetical protein [Chitinophaga agri]
MDLTLDSTYQAAVKVADEIENHFSKHLAIAAVSGEEDLATVPHTKFIEKMLDVAFWASLRREEGIPTRISLAFLNPCQAGKPLKFASKLPFDVRVLTKLAPGVERAGVHVGVWYEGDSLYIWGTTLKLPNFCFVLDVSEPGLLVVKHRRSVGLGKFANVAVLKGDQVKIVDESCGLLPDSPGIVTSLLGLTSSAVWNDPVNVLIQIAVSMRAHKRGGILLVVPSGSTRWKESIVHPLTYPLNPAFSGVADLVRQDGGKVTEIFWQNALRREVDNITGLTAVDGASVITDKHELVTFGAKITRAPWSTRGVDKVVMIEPVIGGTPELMHPSAIGGTRHLSAAQFVNDQPDAIALVASQDGYFTVFSWSEQVQLVQAHRIDTLLL